MSSADGEPQYVTSGLLRLTRPQLIGTMAGMVALLAAIDQTIAAPPGTSSHCRIRSLSGATIYLLSSTVPPDVYFASLSVLRPRRSS
jgi:hypothetical protein